MTEKELMSKRIKDKRLELGLTMEELGDMLGVRRQAVYKWESGGVETIKRNTISKMARIFGCNPVWLMGLDVESRASDDTLHESFNVNPQDTTDAISRLSAYKALIEAVQNVKPENYDAALKMLRSLS